MISRMASDPEPTSSGLFAKATNGVLLYGLTPPRATATSEQADTAAQATLARLRSVQVDGLIIYDVADKDDRATTPRPFPFMPMMDPGKFLDNQLTPRPRSTRPPTEQQNREASPRQTATEHSTVGGQTGPTSPRSAPSASSDRRCRRPAAVAWRRPSRAIGAREL